MENKYSSQTATPTEQQRKNMTIQGEIIDFCYKAEEITKAASFILTDPPEIPHFDPVPMIDAILDYILQIEGFVECMKFDE